MLIRRLWAVLAPAALLLAMSGDLFGKSQRHPADAPPVQSPSSQPAQTPATDQRGTDQIPLTVKILPGQESKGQAEKQERERAEKAETDRRLADQTQRLADDTGWLAIITTFLFVTALGQVALFFWQLRLIYASLGDTKIAAEAAKESARAARDSVKLAEVTAQRQLRAYVHIEDVRMSLMNSDFKPLIQIIIKNYGHTPARQITSISQCGLAQAQTEEYGDLAPGERVYSTFSYPIYKWREEKPLIASKKQTFYVFGRIDYVDAFYAPWYTEFRYRLLIDVDGIKDETSLVTDGRAGNETT